MDLKEPGTARSVYRKQSVVCRWRKERFGLNHQVSKDLKIRRKLPTWQNHRKTALPPYSDKEIQYYKEKLIKFKLVYPDILDPKHEYYWEAKHCQEVLDSHQRLLDMEQEKQERLHDDQDPSSILPPN